MLHNIEQIRADFPILSEKIHGKPLVYFDNAATTQKPRQVVEKLTEAYYKYNSNIHRGVHHLSQVATEAHESARKTVQQFIGAQHDHEIVFTRGTTESINLVASSFCETFCQEGDEILISQMEHHSNIVPWQLVAERKKLVLKVVPFLDNGELDMEAYKKMLSDKTKIISIAHVANSTGIINPIKEIINLAHEQNVPVLIDAAQSVPHFKINVTTLDCDFLVFSGHKMYGPTGIGVLYGKENLLNKMPPYQGGGEMIETVTFEKTTYNALPFKFEAGTPDYIASVGLAEAIRYIETIGMDAIKKHEDELLAYATEQIKTIEGVKIFGEGPHKSGVLSFLINDIHPFDLGTLLDQMGIAIRTGHHCAQPVMDRYKIPGTMRASFAFYNTKVEVDLLIKALKRIVVMFA